MRPTTDLHIVPRAMPPLYTPSRPVHGRFYFADNRPKQLVFNNTELQVMVARTKRIPQHTN